MNVFAHPAAGSPLAVIRPFLAQLPDSFWMPSQASSTASEVDTVFYVIYWISVFFFALIVGLMTWFVIRYRRRGHGETVGHMPTHSLALEITWTAIPVIVSAILFVVGFKSYMNLATPPGNAYEISVTGQKWQWFFTYPNGFVSTELHVPEDQPVTLVMTSEDVIHSLWIPAFRVKKDVLPGRYTHTWFEATEAGTYPLLCTEYLARGVDSKFETHLPYFKKNRIAAYNWGLVAGKIQTQYPWASLSKKFTAEPKIWHHDVLNPDGTPHIQSEVDLMKSLTSEK